jgi:hypothetical protein
MFSVYILYVRVCEAGGGGDCCVPIVYLERRERQKNKRTEGEKEKRTKGEKDGRTEGEKDKRTEEWKREGFRVRRDFGRERTSGGKDGR